MHTLLAMERTCVAWMRCHSTHFSAEKRYMMKPLAQFLPAVLVLAAVTVAAGQTKTQEQHNRPSPPPQAAHAINTDRGQQVFNQNCSRCHNAPEGFSPSISGTIAMHMRVRANLSEADYKALLRFLNP